MRYWNSGVLVVLALMVLAGCSQHGRCLSGDCISGRGVFSYQDGGRYEGDFHGGRPEGKGTMHNPDGSVYRGDFVHGRPQGEGELTLPDGSRYAGKFVDGEFSGKGRLIFPDGQILISTLGEAEAPSTADDNDQGNKGAKEQEPAMPDGTCQSGDCRNGEGNFVFADGSRYSGFFQDGLPQGQGMLEKSDGEFYIGNFVNGLYDGFGVVDYPDGRHYEGMFSGGKPVEGADQ